MVREFEDHVFIAQAEVVGPPHKKYPLNDRHFSLSGRTRNIALLDETTGMTSFIPLRKLPIDGSFLPHVSNSQMRTSYDNANIERSLESSRRGSWKSGIDMSGVWRSKGGNPDYKLPKTGGNALKETSHRPSKTYTVFPSRLIPQPFLKSTN